MTREQLIASLTTNDELGWYDTGADGIYIDWSTELDDGGRVIEAADGTGDVVQIEVTRDQLVDLHRRLTVTLLRDA